MMETPGDSYPMDASAYTLDAMIGRGSTAIVWSATCVPLSKRVAVKLIDLEDHFQNLGTIREEIQGMKQCDHPNVVHYHGSFVHEKQLWLIMEYMPGGSCLDILRCKFNDGMDERSISYILYMVLKGLEYLHSNRHMHRDIKAGNVLLDLKLGVKLADFGFSAMLLDREMNKATSFVGTLCWMAPEIMSGSYNESADLWSFGMTALELAHGRVPSQDRPPTMTTLLSSHLHPPPQLEAKFSKQFRDVVNLCLQRQPHKRPTCSKLLEHKFFKDVREDLMPPDLLIALASVPSLEERFHENSKQHIPLMERLAMAMEQERPPSPVVNWDFGDNRQGTHDQDKEPFPSLMVSGDDDSSSSDEPPPLQSATQLLPQHHPNPSISTSSLSEATTSLDSLALAATSPSSIPQSRPSRFVVMSVTDWNAQAEDKQ